ncbi:uncharacterized protein LOC141654824 [Silene latifolia]|uniref:uncharacterized protein LOC141654824 n=1 Tax=Silene latifolia TaxID=37657 RepID=UPI003D777798
MPDSPHTTDSADSYDAYDDPLYVSTSDNHNQKLVDVPFDGTGFLLWKKDVLMALASKNKEGFVTGTCPQPPTTDKTYRKWCRCDLLVTKWILNSLHKKIKENMMYVSHSQELWEANAYVSLRASSAKDDYSDSAHKKPRVEDEVERARKVCSHCKKIGHLVEECYQLQTCSYCNILGHIREHCYTLKKHRAAQLKAERGGHSHRGGRGRGRGGYKRRANNADTASSYDDDYYEFEMTPLQDEGYAGYVGKNERLVSGLVDTITDRVLKNISKKFDPSSNSGVGSSAGAMNATYSMSFSGISESSHAYAVSNLSHASSWIIDTGASDHMTANPALLHDICDLDRPILVYLPDGTTKLVHQYGTMHLTHHITLHNVFIVPGFKQNLLSIGTLLQHSDMTVTFFQNECWFQDLSSKTVFAKARKHAGLYRITEDLVSKKSTRENSSLSSILNKHVQSNTCMQDSDVFLLHKRLGHTSVDKLKHVPGFQYCNQRSFDCQICILSKHHALPFHRSMSHAAHPFELLHMDVWGPYRVPSMTGAKSFLTILDDHTRTTWIYLIQTKQQVPSFIKDFLVYIETQFHGKVKVIRTDNGSEFIQGPCYRMFSERGIMFQNSIAGVPQQNGRVNVSIDICWTQQKH